jgi:hypothetical protein
VRRWPACFRSGCGTYDQEEPGTSTGASGPAYLPDVREAAGAGQFAGGRGRFGVLAGLAAGVRLRGARRFPAGRLLAWRQRGAVQRAVAGCRRWSGVAGGVRRWLVFAVAWLVFAVGLEGAAGGRLPAGLVRG